MTQKELISNIKNSIYLPENLTDLYELTDPNGKWFKYIENEIKKLKPTASENDIEQIKEICVGKAIQYISDNMTELQKLDARIANLEERCKNKNDRVAQILLVKAVKERMKLLKLY